MNVESRHLPGSVRAGLIHRSEARPLVNAGVLALAAAMHGQVDVAGHRVGIILSGGNVDLAHALELFKTLPPSS